MLGTNGGKSRPHAGMPVEDGAAGIEAKRLNAVRAHDVIVSFDRRAVRWCLAVFRPIGLAHGADCSYRPSTHDSTRERSRRLVAHRATHVADDLLLSLRICQPDRRPSRGPGVSDKQRCQRNAMPGLIDCLHPEEGCLLMGTLPLPFADSSILILTIRGTLSFVIYAGGWAGEWPATVGPSHYGTIVLKCNAKHSVAQRLSFRSHATRSRCRNDVRAQSECAIRLEPELSSHDAFCQDLSACGEAERELISA
jgi:hypothetical protein